MRMGEHPIPQARECGLLDQCLLYDKLLFVLLPNSCSPWIFYALRFAALHRLMDGSA